MCRKNARMLIGATVTNVQDLRQKLDHAVLCDDLMSRMVLPMQMHTSNSRGSISAPQTSMEVNVLELQVLCVATAEHAFGSPHLQKYLLTCCWLVLQHNSPSRSLCSAYTIPGVAEALWRVGFPMQVGISAFAGKLVLALL